MVRNGVEITHPFKGRVDIGFNALPGGEGGFRLWFFGIPSEACISILRHDHGRSWHRAYASSPVGGDGFDGGNVPTVVRARRECGDSVAMMNFGYRN